MSAIPPLKDRINRAVFNHDYGHSDPLAVTIQEQVAVAAVEALRDVKQRLCNCCGFNNELIDQMITELTGGDDGTAPAPADPDSTDGHPVSRAQSSSVTPVSAPEPEKIAKALEFIRIARGQNWTDKPLDEFTELTLAGLEKILREPPSVVPPASEQKTLKAGDWVRLKNVKRIYEVERVDDTGVHLLGHPSSWPLSYVTEIRSATPERTRR